MSDPNAGEKNPQIFELMDGDIRVWIEQEIIFLVAFDRPYKDPVELTAETAKKLAAFLLDAANQLGD